MHSFYPTHSDLGWLCSETTHLSKTPMWVKKNISLHHLWVEESLPDFCWSSAEGQWELLLGDISGIPGQAWHVLSPGPPPGPAACWSMLWTLPSVLPPVGKLANEAAQAALPWFGRSARGLEKEEGGCGAARDAPWCFREPLHNTFLMSAPPEGCWNVSEPSGKKWSVAGSSWTLTAAI